MVGIASMYTAQIEQELITAQIDTRATKAIYEALPAVDCVCAFCRNFVPASVHAPKAIQNFLHSLGVDIQKPAEAICYHDPNETMLLYNGIYHLAGEIVGRPTGTTVNISQAWGLAPNQVSVATRVCLVEEGFPPPIVQIDVWMSLPWVLDEARPSA